MKHLKISSLGILALLCSICSAAAPPDTLTLPDLVNHPDRWPSTVTVTRDFQFTNGVIIHSGDKVNLSAFDGRQVTLLGPKNTRFAVAPQDCNLLDAANALWTALTPAQRAVDPASLAADITLWPVKVVVATAIRSPVGSIPAGAEVDLFNITAKNVQVLVPNTKNAISLDFAMTDVIDRARNLVLIDPDQRPSRIAAALEKIMVDSDGKPFKDDHLQDKKIFAFYFGAGWCQPCRDFSPQLMKFANDALPAHPELSILMLNEDKSQPDMLAYMKDENMPFPAVAPKDWDASRLLSSYVAQIIPQFTVVDRFGKVLASNDDQKGNRGDPADAVEALKKIIDSQPTTKP